MKNIMRQIIFSVCVLIPSTLFAQKVGDTVVVIAEKSTELKSGDDVVGTVPRGNQLRVDKVNEEYFWVKYLRTKGWINRNDVIHNDKAIDYFTKAILKNPNAGDYVIRGTLWRSKSQNDKAINDYNEAIRLDAKYALAYTNRGLVWYYKGQSDKAITDFSEAIRLDPKDADTYTSRGLVWYDKGHFDKSIADYSEAIRLDPKDIYAYISLAWIHAACPVARYRNGHKAVENARKACELTNWKRHYAIRPLAAAYAENGDFEQAVKWQKKAIELAPTIERADFRSHLELYKSGKPYRDEPKK